MTDDERARELWELGTKRLSEDKVEEAVKLFEQSIAVKPTATPFEDGRFRTWVAWMKRSRIASTLSNSIQTLGIRTTTSAST
jgi:hypothetical protein